MELNRRCGDGAAPRPALRPVPSTGGAYLAGEDGSVWRAADPGSGRPARRIEPRPYGGAAGMRRRGAYLRVNVCVGGVSRQRAVHRVVAEAWLADWSPALVVHHVNADPRDNRPQNLRMLTRAEHELEHGLAVRGADLAGCLLDARLRGAALSRAERAAAAPRALACRAAAAALAEQARRAIALAERAGEVAGRA